MLDRPFYFIVVMWGARFRTYFLDLCLPTLLAPGNLPSLKTKLRSKFLICTRPEDWEALLSTPAFDMLAQHVDPVYVEIPPCQPGVPGGVHMGTGHRRACALAHAAKAYGLVVTPDCIFSDGTVARVQELARQGVELALAPALRFAKEPLFGELERAGILPHGRKDMAAPITLGNRELLRMAFASMHSETKSYEWDAPYFHPIPSAVWWRVPGADGIVVHSLSWAPLLFDYAAVPEHDSTTLDHWTLDGDYIYKNLGNIKRIHLVLDSDDMFMVSWAPANENAYDLSPQKLLARPIVGDLVKRHRFSEAFYKGYSDPSKPKPFLFDPLKQQIFFRGARWHAKPLSREWEDVERRALRTLYSCVVAPADARVSAALPPRNASRLDRLTYSLLGTFVRRIVYFVCAVGLAILRVRDVFRHFWIHREALLPRLRQVMAGDRDVIRWLAWRARELAYYLAGRVAPGKPPRPNR